MRKTVEQIFEEIGLNREQIAHAAAVAGLPPEAHVVKTPDDKRPSCLVCGNRINAKNCRLFRQKTLE